MAKQSVVDMAIAEIDAKIEDLQRARLIIINASAGEPTPAKTRQPRRKRAGLPEQSSGE